MDIASRGLALILSLCVVACSSSAPASDAAVATPCPTTSPSNGASCAVPNQRCVYAHCATEGLVSALCQAGDGGSGSWSVISTPCVACGGSTTCMGEMVCADRIGGAVIAGCTANACGMGPIDCACACGSGVSCTIYGTPASDGALFGCNVGCGSSLCP